MTTYYDEEGNPIEGVLSPEEVAALKEEKEKALQEKEAELEKLRNKDLNFKKLREMTEEEKAKLSATELALKAEQDRFREEQQSFYSGFVSDIKDDLLETIAGDDEDLRKSILANYDRIKDSDTARSRKEISAIMHEAAKLAGVTSGSKVSPLVRAANYSGRPIKAPEKSFSETEEGRSLAKELGLGFIKEEEKK